MAKQFFETTLEKDESSEATGIYIPFDVEEVFGAKRLPVRCLIKDVEFRSTVTRMGGRYMIPVNKKVREAAGIKAGETIRIEMDRDTEPRTVTPPDDLLAALNENLEAKEAWEKLSFTHQKEFALVIEEAKKEETRARRINKIIGELLAKRKKRA